MADDEVMVRAVKAHKVYNSGAVSVHALRGIDLDIRKGEMVAVMGPSGCGKTTLLNCLSGLDDLSEGEVFIEGVPLTKMSDRAKTKYRALRMGFIFQSYNLLPVLTALENVELPLLYRGVGARERHKRAREALAAVGLTGWESHTPAELSGGQMQRVAIARAIVTEPSVLFADEPTGNLDAATGARIIRLLFELNQERGATLVLVTHDESIAQRCTRRIYLDAGRLVERT